MLLRILTIISISLGMSSAISAQVIVVQLDSAVIDSIKVLQSVTPVDSILRTAESYLGTSYKYGSQSTKSFDCSGFVRQCYSSINFDLPHSSSAQSEVGEKIKLKNVQPGDLMFFKGRSTKKKTIGHVAIVHSIDENGNIFMIHASTSRGVIIECYNTSEYFTKRFVVAKRLLA
ncbi:MAG: C40 family peptidase [Flavobacteriales bacterium]